MLDWTTTDGQTGGANDPRWYKDAIIYQLHVRAFCDSDADGIGDFKGLTQKLDYLQDLGVTTLWLLPFYPSPLRDDGYDIADYEAVHPNYGTLEDFEAFLREAHRRGLRVITELVINHTSDQHPWFQRSRRAKPGSRWREFYVWSETPEKYRDARIIFKDYESSNWAWDPVANAFYWHRFFSHQPDLNFDNPDVHEAVIGAMEFWFDMGVDGLRLDAIPYLYEREGTTCENLPETHAFLKKLRDHVDAKYSDRMLLAEANQWPEDAVAYFGDGDECHMAFHFPVMPRIFMAVRMEDRFPIVDIMQQTPEIPDVCQWAIFLRNHDELTLEMVTDEERDYMYRTYAREPRARINLGIRRRLAPLMDHDRRRIELMNCLLFTLPGTPIIYYGDEIGMGDNIYLGDRNGVRTPMQWSPDLNAGFSDANPQGLYLPVIIDPLYHYTAVNVELQQQNLYSLLWWMKRHIAVRKHYQVFSRGKIRFLDTENNKVLAFLRGDEEDCLLVVANLSRFAQQLELPLGGFEGRTPVELFGRSRFEPVGSGTYRLSLGAYEFYWFALERQPVGEPAAVQPAEARLPVVSVSGTWKDVLRGAARSALERALPAYLATRTWFNPGNATLRSVFIAESLPIAEDGYLTLIEVEYADGERERYALPLSFAAGDRAYELQSETPEAVVARVQTREKAEEGVLYDALWDADFALTLLAAVERERNVRGAAGELRATHTDALAVIQAGRRAAGAAASPNGEIIEAAEVVRARPDQEPPQPVAPAAPVNTKGHTTVVYGDEVVLKLFRRVDEGLNPDLEMGLFLTQHTGFDQLAPVAGALEYRVRGQPASTVGVLHGFIPNASPASTYTLDALGRYFEAVLTRDRDDGLGAAPVPTQPLLSLTRRELPEQAGELIGAYIDSAQLLGQRTAELHLALAHPGDNPDFAPESFSPLYARPLYQSWRNVTRRTLQTLRRWTDLADAARDAAVQVGRSEDEILQRFRAVLGRRITAQRIRVHGDYRLDNVLFTGRDFVISDFEGDPAHTLAERRRKRTVFRDVAAMLVSLHAAAYMSMYNQATRGLVSENDLRVVETWARYWYLWVGATFLSAYLQFTRDADLLPETREETQTLLDAYLLEQAVEELAAALQRGRDGLRISIPLWAILEVLPAGE